MSSKASSPELKSYDIRKLLPVFLICLAVLICYAGTLGHGFVHDDEYEILNNPAVQDISQWNQFFAHPAWTFLSKAGRASGSNYYRPIQYLTYGIIYHLVGSKPWGYHLYKMLLHLAVCLLLFHLARLAIKNDSVALMAGLIFAVHPINTEAVSWISGITDVTCAFFLLLACIFHLRDLKKQNWVNPVLIALFYFLALLSKETAIVLIPLLLFILFLWRHPLFDPGLWKRYYAPPLLCTVGYLILRINAIGGFTYSAQYKFTELNFWQSLLNQFYLASQYWMKFVFPYPLIAFHPFEPVTSITDWRMGGAFLVLSIVSGLIYFSWRRLPQDQALWIVWGCAWFMLTLTPVIILFKRLGENVFTERYLYPASLGLCLVAGIAFNYCSHANRILTRTLLFGIIFIFGGQTILRNQAWKDNLSLYEDTVKKSPRAYRTWTDLGATYLQSRRFREAKAAFETSLAIKPTSTAYGDLAHIHSGEGKLAEARLEYARALELEPLNDVFLAAAAEVDWAMKDFSSASLKLAQAVKIDPQNGRLWRRLAETYTAMQKYVQAIQAYEKMAALNPPDVGAAYLGMSQNYQALNQPQKASEAIRKYVAVTSDGNK